MRRRVEKPIVVRRIIENVNVSFVRGHPLDEREQACRVACERPTIIVDAVKDRCRNREHHAGRIKFSFRQDMVDQIAVRRPLPSTNG